MQKEPINGDSYYDYICVVDFEATCEEGNPPEFIHEIIEFPIVLLNTRTLEIVSDIITVTMLLFYVTSLLQKVYRLVFRLMLSFIKIVCCFFFQ